MRKVRFNRYIPSEYMQNASCKTQGTGEWEKDFNNKGIFLAFGVIGSELGITSNVALIEMEDGTVEEVSVARIKFEDKILDERDARSEAEYLTFKLGSETAYVQCLQEIGNSELDEDKDFWSEVINLIKIEGKTPYGK